jgi:short-subunit dehydrogenase
VVTGASSGIGAAFAERFARDGYDLIVIARRRERLEALAARLRQHGAGIVVLVADLTNTSHLREVEAAVASCETLEMLVNCAGVAGYMPFVQLPPDQARSLIHLHVVAPTCLTRAALPGMIDRRRGAVINVSSALAYSASLPAPPLPYRAVYVAAKSYLNTFTEVVSNELKGTGVQIQALCPGVVRTELHDVADYDVSHIPFMMEPDDVVSASLAALRLGEVICIPALEDTATLAEAQAAQTRIMQGARAPSVASRYAPGE